MPLDRLARRARVALVAVALGAVELTGPGAAAHPAVTASSAAAAPTGVTVRADSGRAWVSWTAPSAPGGTVTGYRITPMAADGDLPAQTIASASTSAYVRDLPDGRALRFRVAAVTSGGVGPDSAPSAVAFLPYGSAATAVDALYLRLLARGPTSAERAAGVALLDGQADLSPLVLALRHDTDGVGSDAASVADPVARLYSAYFLRPPDYGGLTFWVAEKRDGRTLVSISAYFARSPEFQETYGSLSNSGFVDLIYRNVLRRGSDPEGRAFWIGELDSGRRSRGRVMAGFSESAEYRDLQAQAVDVAVTWAYLAQAGLTTGELADWLDRLGSGAADPADLVLEAMARGVAANRWFCLDHEPTTAADQWALLNHRDDRWRIGDNARSVALPDGRVLWLFADTLYGKVNANGTLPASGWGYTHGSALVQDGRCIEPFYSATSSTPVSLVPSVSSTEFFWPQSGWVDGTGTTLWVIAGRRVGNPTTGGADGGMVVARFSLPDLTFEGTTPLPKPPSGKGLTWGVALHDGPWVYVYADAGPDPAASWPFDHNAARFPDTGTGFLSGAGWQYWNGSGWSTSSSAIAPMSFPHSKLGWTNVVKTATGYALVTKPYKGTPPGAFAWSGPSPAGPWTEVGPVADLSAVPDGRTYAVHPETTIGSVGPLIVWSQSPVGSGTIAGAQVGVAAPLRPLG